MGHTWGSLSTGPRQWGWVRQRQDSSHCPQSSGGQPEKVARQCPKLPGAWHSRQVNPCTGMGLLSQPHPSHPHHSQSWLRTCLFYLTLTSSLPEGPRGRQHEATRAQPLPCQEPQGGRWTGKWAFPELGWGDPANSGVRGWRFGGLWAHQGSTQPREGEAALQRHPEPPPRPHAHLFYSLPRVLASLLTSSWLEVSIPGRPCVLCPSSANCPLALQYGRS